MTYGFIIENELPHSIVFKGIHFKETRDLTMKQIALFIERDIFQLLKHSDNPENSVALSVIDHQGTSQIRVSITVGHQHEADRLRSQIEQMMWVYNHQTFIHERGQFRALPSRYQFHIEITVVEPGS